MPLTFLAASAARKISDLKPLKGMKLNYLSCWGSSVSDLSPLQAMPLTGLECHGTRVIDLSPLRGMPLKTLTCDFKPERDAEILRSIKTLESIHGLPVKEFLKEVDAKKPGKKQRETRPRCLKLSRSGGDPPLPWCYRGSSSEEEV